MGGGWVRGSLRGRAALRLRTRIASVNYASDIGDVRARARHNCGTEATM